MTKLNFWARTCLQTYIGVDQFDHLGFFEGLSFALGRFAVKDQAKCMAVGYIEKCQGGNCRVNFQGRRPIEWFEVLNHLAFEFLGFGPSIHPAAHFHS